MSTKRDIAPALNSSLMRSVRTGPRSSEKKKQPHKAPSRLVLDVVPKTRVGIVRPNGDLRNNPPLSYSSIRRSHPLACVLARETVTLLIILTEITATIKRNGKDVRCDPYTSSGTSYSKFVIEASGPDPYLDLPFGCGAFHDTGPPYTDDDA